LFTVAYEGQKLKRQTITNFAHMYDSNTTKPNVKLVHFHSGFSACPNICATSS